MVDTLSQRCLRLHLRGVHLHRTRGSLRRRPRGDRRVSQTPQPLSHRREAAGMKARAAVMTGPGVIAVMEFSLPEPEPGAVLMRVSLSGICGTDKHTFFGETSQYSGTPHARQIAYPLICG